MTIVFWATVAVLGVLGVPILFAIVVDGIADAILPDFLKKKVKDRQTGVETVSKVGTFAAFARGLGKWWAMLAMLGGIMTLLIWARTDAEGVSALIPIILLSIGGSTMLWSHGLNRMVKYVAKSRALIAIVFSSALLACVLFAAFVLNPNAGWYPVQVRTLNVPIVGEKTEKVRVVPTPSGGFFKATDVFGEVVLENIKTTTGASDGAVLLDVGLAPHVPGYDLKYEPVKNTPFKLSFIKESWKGSVQDSFARKGVREYRSAAELANVIAPEPTTSLRIDAPPADVPPAAQQSAPSVLPELPPPLSKKSLKSSKPVVLFDPETSAEFLDEICSSPKFTTKSLREAAGCDD